MPKIFQLRQSTDSKQGLPSEVILALAKLAADIGVPRDSVKITPNPRNGAVYPLTNDPSEGLVLLFARDTKHCL